MSLADLMESHVAEKADLERYLAASEDKLADSERRMQVLEHKKDILNGLANKFDERPTKLKSSEEKFHFLEDKVSEQNSQLVEKNVSSSVY